MSSIGMNATIRIAGAWRPMPATATTKPERRGEAVARRRRGDADDDARHEAERARLQPLLEGSRSAGSCPAAVPAMPLLARCCLAPRAIAARLAIRPAATVDCASWTPAGGPALATGRWPSPAGEYFRSGEARLRFPTADAQDDFQRARRRQACPARPAPRARRGDVNLILPFDEVVDALGRTGERELGLQVDRARLDRRHRRPRHAASTAASARRARACARAGSGSATAMRRGEPLPPISVYRVGEVHFVRDGHHRVSVARALGPTRHRRATSSRSLTRVGADARAAHPDLPLKSHERLFRERVPLPRTARAASALTDPGEYGSLAEGVEAWGFRAMQERAELLTARCGGGLVRRRVRAGRRDAARGRHARPRDRGRRVHAHRQRPLRAHAHPRLERGDHRAAQGRRAQALRSGAGGVSGGRGRRLAPGSRPTAGRTGAGWLVSSHSRAGWPRGTLGVRRSAGRRPARPADARDLRRAGVGRELGELGRRAPSPSWVKYA